MADHAFDLTLAQAKLTDFLSELSMQNCALACSGGTDSTLLLYLLSKACRAHQTKLFAMFARTELQTHTDLENAQAHCAALGVDLTLVQVHSLDAVAHNPPNRCYLCKKELFTQFRALATAEDCPQLIDGTNADDLHNFRPGLQALAELSVISPLAQCGIKKSQVRALLAQYGLSAAAQPSSACLATRFAYGMELNADKLQRVGKAEEELHALGFYNVRVRVHPGSIVRLELDQSALARALTMSAKIIDIVKAAGFNYVTLDLQGFRSGSMDELLKTKVTVND